MTQRENLGRWLWTTSLSRYFASSNTSQNASDLAKMRDFAKGEATDFLVDRPFNRRAFVSEGFALNKAISKTFALVLAQNNPKRLLDGAPINTYQALSVVNRHEYHHIFPQAYLRSSGVDQSLIDKQANICLLNKGDNTTISDQRPSVYFKELATKLGNALDSVLQSNFISPAAYNAGLRDDYDEFTRLRAELIIQAAEKLGGYEQGDSNEQSESSEPEGIMTSDAASDSDEE